jgi:acyl-CoA thioesterase-1
MEPSIMLSSGLRYGIARARLAWVALAVLLALAVRADAPRPILVVGDSLSAAYGIASDEGWVALLARRLREQGYGEGVVNASVSGDTSRGAAGRLPDLLARHAPAIVIIEIGGNDGLRGLPLDQLRGNIERMIDAAEAGGARVLLLGMRIPPNYGPRYAEEFHALYEELARQHDASLVPFLLDGVAMDPQLMQEDGIHPRAAAQPLILDLVWARLEPILKNAGARGPPPSAAPAHD